MISHLGSDLVAALTSLNVNNFSHFAIFFDELFFHSRRFDDRFASPYFNGIGATVFIQPDFGLKKRAASTLLSSARQFNSQLREGAGKVYSVSAQTELLRQTETCTPFPVSVICIW